MLRVPKISLVAMASAALMATSNTETTASAKLTYTVPLSGHAETNIVRPAGGTGDPDGTGLVKLTIDQSRKQICYDFELTGLATPMMAHIHRGPPLRNGPSVVTLFTGMGGELEDCVLWTNKQLSAIVAAPSNYYVNLYTTEFPDGALRGQLLG